MICHRKWKHCHHQLAPLRFLHTNSLLELSTITTGTLPELFSTRWQCWQQSVSFFICLLQLDYDLIGCGEKLFFLHFLWLNVSLEARKLIFSRKNHKKLLIFVSINNFNTQENVEKLWKSLIRDFISPQFFYCNEIFEEFTSKTRQK